MKRTALIAAASAAAALSAPALAAPPVTTTVAARLTIAANKVVAASVGNGPGAFRFAPAKCVRPAPGSMPWTIYGPVVFTCVSLVVPQPGRGMAQAWSLYVAKPGDTIPYHELAEGFITVGSTSYRFLAGGPCPTGYLCGQQNLAPLTGG